MLHRFKPRHCRKLHGQIQRAASNHENENKFRRWRIHSTKYRTRLASGEYVWFVDADDFILLSALETLYNAAKESDADVVYTGSHYQLRKRDLVRVLRDGKGKQLQEDNIEDTPTLIVNEFDRNLHALIFEKGFTTPWTHFVRKDLLLKNNITFPAIPKAGDYIWAINVYCYAEKFLRFTTPLYFYRIYNANSVSQRKANVNELFDWVSAFATFAKSMMSLSERIEILRKNPSYCYEASRRYFNWCLNRTNDARKKLSNQEMYEILHREFSNRNDSSNFTIPFLFSTIEENSRDIKDNVKIIDRLQKELDQFNKSSARPLISVIIPLYNSEKYIAECLDSILNQTFQNFELIG